MTHYKLLLEKRSLSNVERADRFSDESADAWATRLGGRLCGLLKEELASYGGGEEFLRWIRSEQEDQH